MFVCGCVCVHAKATIICTRAHKPQTQSSNLIQSIFVFLSRFHLIRKQEKILLQDEATVATNMNQRGRKKTVQNTARQIDL